MKQLYLFMNEALIGTLRELDTGRHVFIYDDLWLNDPDAIPLSQSMPKDIKRHDGRIVTNYLNNLLPDNEATRRVWGRQFGVSHKNPFALLTHTGADCPGALQILPNKILPAATYEPVDSAYIEARLRTLKEEEGAWQDPQNRGQFSLAGAQRKMALHYRDQHWSLPSGSGATTHILKPPIPGFRHQEYNECFCLWLADELELAAAQSEVQQFGEETAIVIKRFDRLGHENDMDIRLHNEDMCQALGIPPENKYQSEGGPTPNTLLNLLDGSIESPLTKRFFIQALFFNWLVLGTDAHTKNYSIMYVPSGYLLAPLYDISSYLPYLKAGETAERTKMAMYVAGKKHAGDLARRHWAKLINDAHLPTADVMDVLDRMLATFENAVRTTQKKAIAAKMPEDFITQLAGQLIDWHRDIKRMMGH